MKIRRATINDVSIIAEYNYNLAFETEDKHRDTNQSNALPTPPQKCMKVRWSFMSLNLALRLVGLLGKDQVFTNGELTMAQLIRHAANHRHKQQRNGQYQDSPHYRFIQQIGRHNPIIERHKRNGTQAIHLAKTIRQHAKLSQP